jgi:serine/threonine protein kinase
MFPAVALPDTVGSYKILRRLPGSGVAEVFLAKAQGPMGFERECELKLMPDTSDGDASFAEELAREAAICAKLNHPAVVRVFDFFADQGKLVLALEHIDGEPLSELVAGTGELRGRMADAAIFHVGARIAGALADAHALKDEDNNPTPIIHRNISPDVVIVSADGEVRLTGFGMGKIVGRTPDTAIGRVKGTPGFMAPEQARGEVVTPKTDVYGIGLLLWSLLTGQRPPTDGTWPRRIAGVRGDLPREITALIEAALDHFPGTRKISARELEQWLSKAASAAKAKNELRQRVAAYRAARDGEPAPPSPRGRLSSASPYKGVSFGALRADGSGDRGSDPTPAPSGPVLVGSPRASAARSTTARSTTARSTVPAAPRTRTGAHAAYDPSSHEEPPERTQTATGLGKVVLNLPPPPPPANERSRFDQEDVPRALPKYRPEALTEPAAEHAVEHAPAAPATAHGTPILLAPVMPLQQVVDPALSPAPSGGARVVRFGPPPDATPPPAAVVAPPVAPTFGTPPPTPGAPTPGAPTPGTSTLGAPTLGALTPASPTALPAVAPVATPAPPVVTPAPAIAAPSAHSGSAPLPTISLPRPPSPSRADLPPPRRPLPSILTHGPGRRSLSTLGAIIVSAVTAVVVVSLALLAFGRRGAPPAPTASAAPVVVRPAPTVTASATAAPAPAATASADPSTLPLGYAYLTVVSPANAMVYLSGKRAGEVNQALRVRCGRWFVRLATPQVGRYPEWVTEGETVVIPCQESIRIEMRK